MSKPVEIVFDNGGSVVVEYPSDEEVQSMDKWTWAQIALLPQSWHDTIGEIS